jgi:hypothetical protein
VYRFVILQHDFSVPVRLITGSLPGIHGCLLNGEQVFSREGTHLKTYVYSLPIPTTASFVSLVVAPLVVLPDRHLSNVSHLCLPGMDATLNASISTFHTVFRCLLFSFYFSSYSINCKERYEEFSLNFEILLT